MNISRSLFLALTAAMAGTGACNAYVEPAPPPPPAPAPPPPPQRGAYYYRNYYNRPAPPAPPVATYATPSGPYGYPTRPAPPRVPRVRNVRPVGLVTADPGYRPPPPNLGDATIPGPTVEAGVSPPIAVPPAPTAESLPPRVVVPPATPPAPVPPSPASEGCLDTASMPVPECSSLPLDASCGTRSFVLQRCQTYRTYMDAKVATVAISCMQGMSSRQLCGGTAAYDCGKHALAEACPDTELAQMCSIAAASCHTSASDCTALLSGLNEAGKQSVARCIASGCHAGLYSCVEGLAAGR